MAPSTFILRLPNDRAALIVRVLLLSIVVQLALSYRLWLPVGREFPMIEAIPGFQVGFGVNGDAVLLLFLALAVIVLVARPSNRIGLGVLIGSYALLVLEDVTRLQPWLYFDIILVAVIVVERAAGRDRPLEIVRLLVAGFYVWSGLQKFNHAFAADVAPWLAEPYGLDRLFASVPALAWCLAAGETALGVALVMPRVRRIAGIVGVVMHLVLLGALGPLGQNWNVVVWPWNIAMAFVLVLITQPQAPDAAMTTAEPAQPRGAAGRRPSRARNAGRTQPSAATHGTAGAQNGTAGRRLFDARWPDGWWPRIAVLLVWVAPALSLVGLWDVTLAVNLYSGNTPEPTLLIATGERHRLPQSAQPHLYPYSEPDKQIVMVDQWALEHLGAAMYLEKRYYPRLADALGRTMPDSTSAVLYVQTRDRFTGDRSTLSFPVRSPR